MYADDGGALDLALSALPARRSWVEQSPRADSIRDGRARDIATSRTTRRRRAARSAFDDACGPRGRRKRPAHRDSTRTRGARRPPHSASETSCASPRARRAAAARAWGSRSSPSCRFVLPNDLHRWVRALCERVNTSICRDERREFVSGRRIDQTICRIGVEARTIEGERLNRYARRKRNELDLAVRRGSYSRITNVRNPSRPVASFCRAGHPPHARGRAFGSPLSSLVRTPSVRSVRPSPWLQPPLPMSEVLSAKHANLSSTPPSTRRLCLVEACHESEWQARQS